MESINSIWIVEALSAYLSIVGASRLQSSLHVGLQSAGAEVAGSGAEESQVPTAAAAGVSCR
jgi:hypothetical protein